MSRLGYSLHRMLTGSVLCAAGWGLVTVLASAAEVRLKDGRALKGKYGAVTSLADQPGTKTPGEVGPLQLIAFLDDDLSRTFFPKREIEGVRRDDAVQIEEKFTIWQPQPSGNRRVHSVGPALEITPFDEFGRRTFTFSTASGPVDVIQGITLITSRYTKVEGLKLRWDMRIATSSIPRDVLHKILHKQIDPKDVEHRKKIARFYLQCEYYKEAREELEAIITAFPDDPNVKDDLAPSIRSLRQLSAQRQMLELKLRRRSGQHQLVLDMLKAFPSEGVAGEILQAVRALIRNYEGLLARGQAIAGQFDALLAEIDDPATRKRIEPIRKEIFGELNVETAELSVNTLDRMAAFQQNLDDPQLLPAEKLSLAISGWLMGTNAADVKLPVTLSLYRVRGLVKQYLNEPVKVNRLEIMEKLLAEEGATPEKVAALLAHMKPAVDPPPPVSPKLPGLYRPATRGLPKEPPVRYLVQLPPEYDPYRVYPTIVTLHGGGSTALHQVDWWAGARTPAGWRAGQATRHGYIVIAPEWTIEHQKTYQYSLREHVAVLNSLRDACKRFAIDTDRVFLTGHSIGGDAAWDIGLAHPDLWAGVIPIVAKSDRFVVHYMENARAMPLYFVGGELDGSKMKDNAPTLDRYLKGHSFNCTVVEYLGRGHENFHDEVLRLFDWMGRLRREFFPRDFECRTMREWDNYFWWVELQGLPPAATVDPADWPPPRGTRPVSVSGKFFNRPDQDSISVSAGSRRVTVWLSPEMVDFSHRINVTINSRRMNTKDRFIKPDLETMLEDVRTRGDRRHPFWAKVEMSSGRVVPGR